MDFVGQSQDTKGAYNFTILMRKNVKSYTSDLNSIEPAIYEK